MVELDNKLKEQYMELRNEYDAVCNSIRQGDAIGLSSKELASLTQLKKSLNEKRVAYEDAMLGEMSQGSNLSKLTEDGWYAIRYLNNKSKYFLAVEPIKEDCIEHIERGRFDRELTRPFLDDMLPSIRNDEVLEKHKRQTAMRVEELLAEHAQVDIVLVNVSDDESKGIRPSSHSRKRRAERKFSVDERFSEEYARGHRRQLDEDIMAEFETAEHIWTDSKGIEFWFGADNTMFVIGENEATINCKAIVTLYESTFGFSKEINRTIVFQQIEVIKQKQEEHTQAMQEHHAQYDVLQLELDTTTDEIALLEAKIEELKAKEQEIVSKQDSLIKQLDVKRKEYDCEYNKLFKKWEVS